MNTKLISQAALAVIDQYKDVPYFNNKTKGRRAGLRVEIGKGSPKEVFDEINDLARLQKNDITNLTGEMLKRFMVENNIGIDCSAFAYYVLDEESRTRGKGSLSRHLHLDRFFARFRQVINTDVLVFVNNKNSTVISIQKVEVGDIVTMIGGERNHILVIYQIEYQNFVPVTLHYVHAIAWPSDGEYGHGIHKGKIEIINAEKSLIEQRWIELEKEGSENYTYIRAKESTAELRRLKWFF